MRFLPWQRKWLQVFDFQFWNHSCYWEALNIYIYIYIYWKTSTSISVPFSFYLTNSVVINIIFLNGFASRYVSIIFIIINTYVYLLNMMFCFTFGTKYDVLSLLQSHKIAQPIEITNDPWFIKLQPKEHGMGLSYYHKPISAHYI